MNKPEDKPASLIALTDVLLELGTRLGFDVKGEVQVADHAWVDVAWFDKRLGLTALGHKRPNLRWVPVLPVMGFEIESRTSTNPKHLKGSVANLENLGASVGVIVVPDEEDLVKLQRRRPTALGPPQKSGRTLLQRIYHIVFAEAEPRVRVVIMTASDVRQWASRAQGNPERM